MQYKLTNKINGDANNRMVLCLLDDGNQKSIPNDEANVDWQEYQAWLAADPENNIPEPADEE